MFNASDAAREIARHLRNLRKKAAGSQRAFWLARRLNLPLVYLRPAKWALNAYHGLAYGRGMGAWATRLEFEKRMIFQPGIQILPARTISLLAGNASSTGDLV